MIEVKATPLGLDKCFGKLFPDKKDDFDLETRQVSAYIVMQNPLFGMVKMRAYHLSKIQDLSFKDLGQLKQLVLDSLEFYSETNIFNDDLFTAVNFIVS